MKKLRPRLGDAGFAAVVCDALQLHCGVALT